jgi:hypothetical protein
MEKEFIACSSNSGIGTIYVHYQNAKSVDSTSDNLTVQRALSNSISYTKLCSKHFAPDLAHCSNRDIFRILSESVNR